MIDVGTQPWYNTNRKDGEHNMKENREAVFDYHSKLTTIRVRFPSEEQCGIDLGQLIRERALEKGFINMRGKDKGTGSANAYILDLIEKDLIEAGKIERFPKGMTGQNG